MQYLLLCCFDEDRWDKLPETERERIMHEYGKFQHDLAASGQYRAGAKLGSIQTATTLRERAGKPVVTDGPFAETKELLGGFNLLNCANLDEAIDLAKRIPAVERGSIEIRPIWEYGTDPTTAGDAATIAG
jgi:hypothetical protein